MIRKVWTNLCRFLLAVTFVFSGFVKAVDPSGFFYKLQEYLVVFHMSSWVPDWFLLLVTVLLAMAEFCTGAFLMFGIRRRISSSLALFLMAVMTPLTLYLALTNPVADCGCFGDAWVLTNWQTFGKNILLLVAAVSVFRGWKQLLRFVTLKLEWMVSLYIILFILAFSYYNLYYLPILDFRPYKIGVDMRSACRVPEGAKLSVLENLFLMEKDGERREFTLEEYPDSTWQFVSVRTVVKEPGYEPPIHDFSLEMLETGEDITDSVLADEGYTFLLVAHRIEMADDSNIDLINEIYDYSVEHGYNFYALTSSYPEEVAEWCEKTGAEYPFCGMDDTALKTMIRSNPGLILLKDGVILNKWSSNNLPDEYVLSDRLENLETGSLRPGSGWQTVGYILLWFFVPLMLVVCMDVLLVKRRQGRHAL